MNIVKMLKKEVNREANIPEETVIKFISGDLYSYAAIWVAGYWWITGTANYFGKNKFEHQEFMSLLNKSGITEVKIATDWELLKRASSEWE